VASTPGRIVMCNRDGEPAVFLEGIKIYFGAGFDCLNLFYWYIKLQSQYMRWAI
jgi:hypothetical protein